jgi:DNA-binding MarR family transcriptional regulator
MSPEQLLALAALLDEWRAGGPFPGYTRLMARTGLTRKAVDAAVVQLEGAGYLERRAGETGEAGRVARRIQEDGHREAVVRRVAVLGAPRDPVPGHNPQPPRALGQR